MNLSQKEQETLERLSQGLSAKEIALLEGGAVNHIAIGARINRMIKRHKARNATHLVAKYLASQLSTHPSPLNS